MSKISIKSGRRLIDYNDKNKPITTEEMIIMGLYDPKYDLDYLEPV